MSAQWVAKLFYNLVKFGGYLTEKEYDKAIKKMKG